MLENFKPKQFDSFDKVPEDQKQKFKKEDDGSFVYKEVLSKEGAIDEAEHMESLKDNPYVRTGNEKYMSVRSWKLPDEPLSKLETEHYERVNKLLEHWEKEQNEYYERRTKEAEIVIGIILESLKSDNMLDFVHEIKDIYFYFRDERNYIGTAVTQAGQYARHPEGSTREDGELAERAMADECIAEFWSKSIYNGGKSLDFFPQPEDVLNGLCKIGESKYPEYDWDAISEDIYFSNIDEVPNEASYYLKSSVENRYKNRIENDFKKDKKEGARIAEIFCEMYGKKYDLSDVVKKHEKEILEEFSANDSFRRDVIRHNSLNKIINFPKDLVEKAKQEIEERKHDYFLNQT